MLRTVLVDDEVHMLERLQKLLGDEKEFTVVGSYSSSNNCLADINEREIEIDVAFLDIEMPRMKGLILAQELLNIDENIEVVFVTAYKNYAVRAFEVNALDYLLKPVTGERFKKTINRLLASNKSSANPEDKSNILKVSCLGEFNIMDCNERELKVNWFTHKARELFIFLLHHRGKEVNSSEIMEALWPDKNRKKSANILYTTIYQLRKMFNGLGYEEVIKSKRGSYSINLDKINLDVIKMIKLVEECGQINNNNIKKVKQIIRIYKGKYLEGEDYIWAFGVRVHLKNKFKDLMMSASNFYREKNEYNKAVEMLKKLIDEDPIDESSHKKLINLYCYET